MAILDIFTNPGFLQGVRQADEEMEGLRAKRRQQFMQAVDLLGENVDLSGLQKLRDEHFGGSNWLRKDPYAEDTFISALGQRAQRIRQDNDHKRNVQELALEEQARAHTNKVMDDLVERSAGDFDSFKQSLTPQLRETISKTKYGQGYLSMLDSDPKAAFDKVQNESFLRKYQTYKDVPLPMLVERGIVKPGTPVYDFLVTQNDQRAVQALTAELANPHVAQMVAEGGSRALSFLKARGLMNAEQALPALQDMARETVRNQQRGEMLKDVSIGAQSFQMALYQMPGFLTQIVSFMDRPELLRQAIAPMAQAFGWKDVPQDDFTLQQMVKSAMEAPVQLDSWRKLQDPTTVQKLATDMVSKAVETEAKGYRAETKALITGLSNKVSKNVQALVHGLADNEAMYVPSGAMQKMAAVIVELNDKYGSDMNKLKPAWDQAQALMGIKPLEVAKAERVQAYAQQIQRRAATMLPKDVASFNDRISKHEAVVNLAGVVSEFKTRMASGQPIDGLDQHVARLQANLDALKKGRDGYVTRMEGADAVVDDTIRGLEDVISRLRSYKPAEPEVKPEPDLPPPPRPRPTRRPIDPNNVPMIDPGFVEWMSQRPSLAQQAAQDAKMQFAALPKNQQTPDWLRLIAQRVAKEYGLNEELVFRELQ
jgi:hypothetical protein